MILAPQGFALSAPRKTAIFQPQILTSRQKTSGSCPFPERWLLRAKHLLESGAGNSTQVAFMTGFNSPSYFAKSFQEMFVEAPGVVAKRRG